jgi:hypothetical protein
LIQGTLSQYGEPQATLAKKPKKRIRNQQVAGSIPAGGSILSIQEQEVRRFLQLSQRPV